MFFFSQNPIIPPADLIPPLAVLPPEPEAPYADTERPDFADTNLSDLLAEVDLESLEHLVGELLPEADQVGSRVGDEHAAPVLDNRSV